MTKTNIPVHAIDIPMQCGQVESSTPNGDDEHACVEHTRTFANFAPSPGVNASAEEQAKYRSHRQRPVQVTPIVLGDRYPVITVARARKFEDDCIHEKVTGARHFMAPCLTDEVEYEFAVPTTRHGYGPDLDAAIIAAIAVKNGAGSMEAADIARFTLRMMRGSDFDAAKHASGWK